MCVCFSFKKIDFFFLKSKTNEPKYHVILWGGDCPNSFTPSPVPAFLNPPLIVLSLFGCRFFQILGISCD